MKIVIDITPIKKEHILQHRVRGTGLYVENLRKALESYFPQNEYNFYTRGNKLPKDIDLVHYPYFEPFFLTLPFKKIVPTVVTVHDLIPLVFPQHFPAGIKGQIKWQMQKLSLRGCQAIITDSQNSKKDIVRYTGIPADKISVVYLAPAPEFRKLPARIATQSVAGGELGAWQLELKKKYHLPDIFVLYVGDATWNKNLPRLLEAIKKIKVPLVLVGKALAEENFDRHNPWNQDLVRIHQVCENNKQILRLGFIPQKDLVALYNLATVFAMPSIYEGFGLPVLEAMACGCPVVTSFISSLPEIAGQAAVYVEPENIENIAQGIQKVLEMKVKEPEKYEELQNKARTQAKNFSWAQTAKKTLAVYQKIIGR